MYKIVFYEDKKGKSEIQDYFYQVTQRNQLTDRKVSKKVRNQLELLKMLGPHMTMPQARFLKRSKICFVGIAAYARKSFLYCLAKK
jgi:hypothetical protein